MRALSDIRRSGAAHRARELRILPPVQDLGGSAPPTPAPAAPARRRPPWQGIRARLIWPLALALLGMLALAFYGYERLAVLVEEDAEREALGLARQAANEYEQTLIRTGQLLEVLSSVPVIRRPESPECQSTLSAMLGDLPAYANIGVVSAKGIVLCSGLGAAGTDLSHRAWFQRALRTGMLSSGDFQVGLITHESTVNLALPLVRSTGEREVLYAAVRLAPLGTALSAALPPDSSVMVLDGTGTILATVPPDGGTVGTHAGENPFVRYVLQTRFGSSRRPGLDGVTRLYAWAEIGTTAQQRGVVVIGLSEKALTTSRTRVVARAMAGLFAVGLLVLALTWFTSSYRVVRRIRRLVGYSRTLQAGALEASSGISGEDELGELARAMEDLAHATRDALRTREDFLSAATHELRAPLTTLMLHTERLLREAGEDPARAARARKIHSQLGRLSRLVDSLLDVSRLESGRFDVQRQPGDLVPVVRRTVDRYRDVAEAAGCELDLRLPESAQGEWDAPRIDLALGNLVSNAIKYAPGQPVQIRLEADEDEVRLCVLDHGPGIRPEDRGRIFQRFERARTAGATPGFGFGLYLTRQIVEAHGGSIQLESEPGRGSEFTIRLPRV